MKRLGQILKELRGNASLREASKLIGISHNYLRNLEKGIDPRTKTPIAPSVETLKKIAKAYNYPLEKLLQVVGYIDGNNKEDFPKLTNHPMLIGKRIAILRKKRGISQEKLAKKINEKFGTNINKGMISKWENGLEQPRLETIRHLALFFNISSDYLFGLGEYTSDLSLSEVTKEIDDTSFDKQKFTALSEKVKGNRMINHCSENDTEAKYDIKIEIEEIIKEIKKGNSSITFRGRALNMLDARDRDLLITCLENLLRLTEQIVYTRNDKRNI
mgnify:CR=1 FL=1